MTPTIVKSMFLEKMNNEYKDHQQIYTDGSVQDEKAGLGIFQNGSFETCTRIQNYSSIYTSELFAIKSCIERYKTYSPANKNILILSDSKSALEGLKDINSKNTIIINIRNLITELNEINFSFFWIPSHFSIEGNEKADKIAKDSLSINVSPTFKFQHLDYRRYIKKHIIIKRNYTQYKKQ